MGSAAATRLGEVLNDAYELHELVSDQGPLEVYRATEVRSRSDVRVKLLRPEFALQSAVVERFLRGPRSLSRVTHASLPTVRVDSDDTGIPFIVEEAVHGRPLGALLEGFPQGLPLGLATHLFLPLCEALELAHAQKVFHGALDPERIVLLGADNAPSLKLLQLGVAREDLGALDPAYRAPELASGAQATAQGDVFALGVLLYRMLSGELPFRTGKDRAEPLDEIAPQLPAPWVELTNDCLELQPARRLRDVKTLLERFRECSRLSSSALQPVRKSDPVPPIARSVTAPPPAVSASVSVTVATVVKPVDPVALEDTAPDFGVEPPKPVATRTISAVAAAFAPLTADTVVDETPVDAQKPEKKKDKSAAKNAAEKLGAKNKGEAVRKETKADDVARKEPKAAESARKEPKAAESARKEPKAPAKSATHEALLGGVHKATPAPKGKAAPVQAARPGAKNQPTQGQIAAVALTETQLNALRAMRGEDEESRDRWLGLFFMLFLMLVLGFGVPLVYEPKMVAAQALFGPKLRVAAGAFAITAMIATVRLWAAQVQGGSLIQRITSYTMTVVAASIFVLTGLLFSQSSTLGMLEGTARHALPLATSFLFFMFAFSGAMRGISNLAGNLGYAVVVIAMSTGSLYGSYHAIFATILKGYKPGHHMTTAASTGSGVFDTARMSPEQIKAQLAGKTAIADGENKPQDVHTMAERKESGANEADDMRSATELGDTNSRNGKELEKLQNALPHLPGAGNGNGDQAPPP